LGISAVNKPLNKNKHNSETPNFTAGVVGPVAVPTAAVVDCWLQSGCTLQHRKTTNITAIKTRLKNSHAVEIAQHVTQLTGNYSNLSIQFVNMCKIYADYTEMCIAMGGMTTTYLCSFAEFG